ncbi:hypothetical protein ANN_13224 [Periplaneta americana]|uniref:HTH psq-type domain-containing protein n=1 Tax=Periplaneta americana TaxID=6978 RepID=A0ABQ8TJS8_PERAM|nr:hypothetical protein ANN_13224 [Periplaneta americana]
MLLLNSIPQVFEAVHLFHCFISNSISLSIVSSSINKAISKSHELYLSSSYYHLSRVLKTVRIFITIRYLRYSLRSKIWTFMIPPVISRPSKGKWHPDSMKQAVEKVLTGQLANRKAAEIYNIPQSTLIDHISAVKRGVGTARLPYTSSRQHSLKWVKGKRSKVLCPVVQQEEVQNIPGSSYECTIVQCLLRGLSTVGCTRSLKDEQYRTRVSRPVEIVTGANG